MTKKPMKMTGPSAPSSDLRDRVSNSPMGEPLPLVHVTELGFGKEILISGQLKATPCKVFDRKLLYFFLGRPAYRLKDETEASQFISRYPCVFVVDPKRVEPSQVYPFDTGAAAAGFYEDADPHLGIQDYLLEGSYEGARKQLGFAFEGTDDYFQGRLRPDLTDGISEFEQATLSYAAIANQANRGKNDPTVYDDRASAIEIATRKTLDLKDAVQLLIVPQQFIEGKSGNQNIEILDRIKYLGIDIDFYVWDPTRTPGDFRAEINGKVLQFIKGSASA